MSDLLRFFLLQSYLTKITDCVCTTFFIIFDCDLESRGEYNVENLKLSRRCHKSCKTQPEGKKIVYLFFNNKRAC